jgi:hypothetical protein
MIVARPSKRRFVTTYTVVLGTLVSAFVIAFLWSTVHVLWFVVFVTLVCFGGGLAWSLLMWRFFVLPFRARIEALSATRQIGNDDA